MRSRAVQKGIALVMLLGLALLFAWALNLSNEGRQPIPTGYAASGQPVFSCPVKASEGFGVTVCYMSEDYRTEYPWDHIAIDTGNGRCGSPVRAMGDGTATFQTAQGGYGTLVTIKYGNGWTSRYAHMQDFAGFSTGTHNVKKSDVVGHIGGECHNCFDDEGNPFKWACHLHYELYSPDGKLVDPWEHSCWDLSIKPGWEKYCTRAQMKNYNPGAAASELDSPDVPGVHVSDVNPMSIVPLAAKLEPNTYSFNPSFRVEIDYTLDEYKTLFDFARNVAETCQDGQPKGVNPCVRNLMAAEIGFTVQTGICAETMEMPYVGFGTYEFCALSPSVFPLGSGTLLDSYSVGYRFAIVLEDNSAPPAVSGLRKELVSESGEPEKYRISWNAPAGVEDIETYIVSLLPGGSLPPTSQSSQVVTISAGAVTVTPKDYAGHTGPSKSITII